MALLISDSAALAKFSAASAKFTHICAYQCSIGKIDTDWRNRRRLAHISAALAGELTHIVEIDEEEMGAYDRQRVQAEVGD